MTEHNRQFDDYEPHVPDRFRGDLQGLFGPPGVVPPQVDQAILNQARQQFAQPRRVILRLRWAAGVAAAAVIVIGVVLHTAPTSHSLRSTIKNQRSIRPGLAEGRADVDNNGRVDILDAFRLARLIESTGPADPARSGAAEMRWDLNGDGRVDKDDVDLVAFAAVGLDKGV